ncbi:MAG: MICOS complex subunit MIC10 family protein [Acidiferrobacteraceae bacterium]
MARSRLLLFAATFVALLLLTAFVYWPGLGGGFLLDDYQNLHILLQLFEHRMTLLQVVFSTDSGPLHRPIAMLSFALNMKFEGPDVWDFKYTNLMIHLLCGVLVFVLARQLFGIWRTHYSEERRSFLALLVAALWLLAPLLVSTTLYTVQRMAQLSALFSLIGMISYVSGRRRLNTRARSGFALMLASVLIFMPLAALSKENGFLLPLLLLVIEVFFFGFSGGAQTRRLLIGFFGVFLALPVLGTLWVLVFRPSWLLASYAGRPFTLSQRLMTEPRVLFYYVRNLLVPNGEGMGVFHDDYVVSTGLLHPVTTLFSIAGWLIVGLASVLAARRRWWPLLFGVCFFLAAQMMESTIIPLELVFEYRNYLPSFGIFFAVVMVLAYVLEQRPDLTRLIVPFMAALPLFYAFGTYQRANVWSSWTSILLSAEQTHPRSPRVHIELASVYSASGHPHHALTELGFVPKLVPGAAAGVGIQRLAIYCHANLPIPASAYRDLPAIPPSNDTDLYLVAALRALVHIIYQPGCPALAGGRLANVLQHWVSNAPQDNYNGALWSIAFSTAQIQRYYGHREIAIEDLMRANRVDPSLPEPLIVAMRYAFDAGRIRRAYQILTLIRRQFTHPGIEARAMLQEYAPLARAVAAAYKNRMGSGS